MWRSVSVSIQHEEGKDSTWKADTQLPKKEDDISNHIHLSYSEDITDYQFCCNGRSSAETFTCNSNLHVTNTWSRHQLGHEFNKEKESHCFVSFVFKWSLLWKTNDNVLIETRNKVYWNYHYICIAVHWFDGPFNKFPETLRTIKCHLPNSAFRHHIINLQFTTNCFKHKADWLNKWHSQGAKGHGPKAIAHQPIHGGTNWKKWNLWLLWKK